MNDSDSSKVIAINRRAAVANKCIGGTYSSLEMFCALMGLPTSYVRIYYTQYTDEKCILRAEESVGRARQEVLAFYGASSDKVIDALVSVDWTWQKRGFSSLFGLIYMVEVNTGKVLDYKVFSKHCSECNAWDKIDKNTEKYKSWKLQHRNHTRDINFEGSAGAMEPAGILELFQRSWYGTRVLYLMGTANLSEAQPYVQDHPVEKLDCRPCPETSWHSH